MTGIVVDIDALDERAASRRLGPHEPLRHEIRALVAEVRRLRTELERTEGDWAVAIREATRAREALKAARPFVAYAGRGSGVVLRLVDAALDKRLAPETEATK